MTTIPSNSDYFDYAVNYQELIWDESDTPSCPVHQDVYFSAENGLAETEYVFLKLNEVAKRWGSTCLFTISELGFGTGLNFLTTWSKWQETRIADNRLVYISFENRPLKISDLKRVHNKFPSIEKYSDLLLPRLELLHPGINTINFTQFNLVLLLVIGDANSYLPVMTFKADAWFLDGFSPDRNQSLWNQKLLIEVGEHSKPNATCSTFSSARKVRDYLQKASFQITKVPGYGRKRESIRGIYSQSITRDDSRHSVKSVAVIGAGLAGCSIARSLSQRGVETTIFDKKHQIAQGASGNALGMLKPDFSLRPDIRSELSMAGFAYTYSLCKELKLEPTDFEFAGAYRSPSFGRLRKFYEQLDELSLDEKWIRKIQSVEASEISGIKVAGDGLFYPNAGWIKPRLLCKSLAINSSFCNDFNCENIRRTSSGWIICDHNKESQEFDLVILANSFASQDLLSSPLPGVTFNHGQICQYTDFPWHAPRIPIIGPGYILTDNSENVVIGSTYEHLDSDLEQNQHRKKLLTKMGNFLDYKDLPVWDNYSFRRSLRCNATDKLPMLGQLRCINNNFNPFIFTALGSKGLLYAPLLGESLACEILGEPVPITVNSQEALQPARFMN